MKKLQNEIPDFIRPGNEDQFNYDVAISEHLDTALHSLKKAEVKDVMEVLEQAKKMIAQ